MSFAKTYSEAKAGYKPMSRKVGLKSVGFKRKPVSSSKLQRRSTLSSSGPRTKEWKRVWAWLKNRLYEAGRTRCEFDFIPHDCWGALFPCHSKKRRKMEGNDIYTVAMGCQQIARYLDEDLSHEEMQAAVIRAINENGGVILR